MNNDCPQCGRKDVSDWVFEDKTQRQICRVCCDKNYWGRPAVGVLCGCKDGNGFKHKHTPAGLMMSRLRTYDPSH
jgi:hypothetical protein